MASRLGKSKLQVKIPYTLRAPHAPKQSVWPLIIWRQTKNKQAYQPRVHQHNYPLLATMALFSQDTDVEHVWSIDYPGTFRGLSVSPLCITMGNTTERKRVFHNRWMDYAPFNEPSNRLGLELLRNTMEQLHTQQQQRQQEAQDAQNEGQNRLARLSERDAFTTVLHTRLRSFQKKHRVKQSTTLVERVVTHVYWAIQKAFATDNPHNQVLTAILTQFARIRLGIEPTEDDEYAAAMRAVNIYYLSVQNDVLTVGPEENWQMLACIMMQQHMSSVHNITPFLMAEDAAEDIALNNAREENSEEKWVHFRTAIEEEPPADDQQDDNDSANGGEEGKTDETPKKAKARKPKAKKRKKGKAKQDDAEEEPDEELDQGTEPGPKPAAVRYKFGKRLKCKVESRPEVRKQLADFLGLPEDSDQIPKDAPAPDSPGGESNGSNPNEQYRQLSLGTTTASKRRRRS